MNCKFLDFIQKYKTTPVALAVSGGVDSVSLLHWYAASGLPAVVLHVNHKLRKESEIEAQYVKATAEKLGMPCHVFEWTGEKPTAGLEAAARSARYGLMLDWCRANNIGVLMTAHQADDQIETFLMNLGRGSGVYGMAGIRPESQQGGIIIARPLLNVFRHELQEWCNSNVIKYFQDQMNEDENYTRVKIRKNRHLLQDRLGISDQRILLTTENLSRAREALESIIDYQLSNVRFDDGRAFFSAEMLFSLPDELQLKFLGELIKRVSGAEYSPRLVKIERLRDALSDDTIATLSNCTIRRLGDKILVAQMGKSISFRNKK